ncbi:hypothetical protein ACFQ88_17650 [Paenibacillus sp. NPDC056579]|uniref:hypothetical protein n=1 Tax=Paenibacillus sp. NPDC056579 TaxID=3345871 RepID=UPI0036987711
MRLLGIDTSSSNTAGAAFLPSGKTKAVWLWDTTKISTNTGRNEIIQFARKKQITLIYLQVISSVPKNAYRAFIRSSASSGIQIHALDGAPDWILPNQLIRISSLVNWVKTYNNSVTVNEQFAGIQVDIEPYLLPEWYQDQETAITNWLEALTLLAQGTQDTTLIISSALPFWVDQIIVPATQSTFIESVFQLMNNVTLMSYRDQAQTVVDISDNKLVLADSLGKRVFVALETNPTSEGLYLTFYDDGQAIMDNHMAEIDHLLSIHPSYAGIAVHDYNGWRNLKP